MYVNQPWTIRVTPASPPLPTRMRYRKPGAGQKGLSVAFDRPPTRGYDLIIRAQGDVGMAGVAID
jgi:methylmalonyl-CoA mutase